MDTQTAIATLQAIQATLTDEVQGSQAKLDAVDIALEQLKDILNTPTQDLIQAQNAFMDAKNAQITAEARVSTLETELAAANKTIEALKAQLDANTPIEPIA